MLVTLDTVCAIGAYYTTLLGHEEKEDVRHEKYFSTALRLAPTSTIERSVTQISLLLARCFYLLVVCRTERYNIRAMVIKICIC